MSKSVPPRSEFRPLPFWAWNERLTPDECRWMMDRIAEGGLGGAYLHVRTGLLIPYMGDKFLECMDAAVVRARDLSLRIGLYDEDRWPSGWAGGKVPLSDPSFRLKALARSAPGEAPPDNSVEISRDENGYRFWIYTMPLGHPKFNGTCYVDLMNAAAVRCFIENAYEPLANRFLQHFGGTIPTVFTDEPALTYLYTWPEGALPWTYAIAPEFEKRTGSPLTAHLTDLFEDRPTSRQTRLHYYQICGELFEQSFMRQISDWCEQRGIAWTGHFMYEHNLALNFSWSVNSHPGYRWFQWPGVDHLGRQVGEVVTALGCRSAVHQFRRPRMMSELYGCSGQHLSFDDRKWIAEQQIVLGANYLVPHLMLHTLAGQRKRDYPPTLSYQQPWWPLNHVLEDHLAELCRLLSMGEGLPDLLLIHPQESTYVLSRGPVPVGKGDSWTNRFFYPSEDPEQVDLDREWKSLCHALLDHGYVTDFGDEGILAEHGKVEMDCSGVVLRVNHACYGAVVVPRMKTIRSTTLELLLAFTEPGGKVFILGDGPAWVDGSDEPEMVAHVKSLREGSLCAGRDIHELVASLLHHAPPLFETCLDGSCHVWRYTRRMETGRLTFFKNLDRFGLRSLEMTVHDPGSGKAWLWNTSEDFVQQVDLEGGSVKLELIPNSSHILFEGPDPPIPSPLARRVPTSPVKTIRADELDWTVERLDENALLLDKARFRIPHREWSQPVPVLAIKDYLDRSRFEGPLELLFEWESDLGANETKSLRLMLERHEKARLVLNSHLVAPSGESVFWRDIRWFPIPIGAAVVRGRNELHVTFPDFEFGDPAESKDPVRRWGTDLEAPFLLGDFAVGASMAAGPVSWEGQYEPHTGTPVSDWLPPVPLRYFREPFKLIPPFPLITGDITSQGLPFYCGRIGYRAEIDIEHNTCQGRRVFFQLEELNAPAAELEVNGAVAGVLAWPPHRVDMSDLIHPGQNFFHVIYYHSLRNLLGPHHHPEGEPVFVNPESFRPEGLRGWFETLERGEPVPRWRDTYCMVQFGMQRRGSPGNGLGPTS